MKARLSRFLCHWNRLADKRARALASLWGDMMSHTRFASAPNDYEEHDIGNKNIRYPDGGIRSVRTRKVKEPGGRTFYVFPEAVLS